MVAIQVHPDQNSLVSAWRASGHYTFPVVFVPQAAPGTPESADYSRAQFGVAGTPSNLLVDAKRKVVFRHLGGAVSVVEAEIRELLGLDPFEIAVPQRRRGTQIDARRGGFR
jgi:hypothetical protein